MEARDEPFSEIFTLLPIQQNLTQEMPVRGGSIVVKVAAFDPARQEVLAAAAGQGAGLLAARTLVDGKGRKHGWLTFRLSASRLPALLGAAQNDGRLFGESIATTDHASEYKELARRIVRLQQHEVRLSGILQSGSSPGSAACGKRGRPATRAKHCLD